MKYNSMVCDDLVTKTLGLKTYPLITHTQLTDANIQNINCELQHQNWTYLHNMNTNEHILNLQTSLTALFIMLHLKRSALNYCISMLANICPDHITS